MAKGQMRSNREAKKPKGGGKKPAAADSATFLPPRNVPPGKTAPPKTSK